MADKTLVCDHEEVIRRNDPTGVTIAAPSRPGTYEGTCRLTDPRGYVWYRADYQVVVPVEQGDPSHFAFTHDMLSRGRGIVVWDTVDPSMWACDHHDLAIVEGRDSIAVHLLPRIPAGTFTCTGPDGSLSFDVRATVAPVP